MYRAAGGSGKRPAPRGITIEAHQAPKAQAASHTGGRCQNLPARENLENLEFRKSVGHPTPRAPSGGAARGPAQLKGIDHGASGLWLLDLAQ